MYSIELSLNQEMPHQLLIEAALSNNHQISLLSNSIESGLARYTFGATDMNILARWFYSEFGSSGLLGWQSLVEQIKLVSTN